MLMAETEQLIYQSGGRQIYAETSSRDQYQPTHEFYETCGYHQEAFLNNFYAEGDGKIIYAKILKWQDLIHFYVFFYRFNPCIFSDNSLEHCQ